MTVDAENRLAGEGFDDNPEAREIFESEIDLVSGDGIKPGMEVTKELLRQLGNPHESLQVIHVAGTNGKGSVCAMLERCLREAGLSTGLFTSPHMVYYNERFRVDGIMIGDDELLALLREVVGAVNETERVMGRRPRQFEILSAMCFYWFNKKNVDVVVLETGMGGRFDATNMCEKPILSIITSISMDHENYLGTSLVSIAGEKAGIIKAGTSLVTSCDDPIALEVLRAEFIGLNHDQNDPSVKMLQAWDLCSWESKSLGLRGQEITMKTPGGEYKDVFLPMSGPYQCANMAAVVLAWETLAGEDYPLAFGREKLTTDALRRGIGSLHWPCRLELVQENPTVVLDGSHNPDGIRKSAVWLEEERHNYQDVILVMGMLQDKDRLSAAAMLDGKVSRLIITRPDSNRAGQWQDLAQGFHGIPEENITFIESCHEAVKTAISLAGEKDLVLCTGSLYLVGEMRKNWPEKPLFEEA